MGKDFRKLECNGFCMLNITGYMEIWKTVCNKCKGTEKEVDLIAKSFDSFNARQIIIGKYDFNDIEKDILHQEWY